MATKKKKPADAALWFALGEFLSEWPEDLTAEEVLSLILKEDSDTIIWEPFEDYPPSWVVSHIRSLAKAAQSFAEEAKRPIDRTKQGVDEGSSIKAGK